MFCYNCGNEIAGKFCGNCGKGGELNSIQDIKKFDEFIKEKKLERRTFFQQKNKSTKVKPMILPYLHHWWRELLKALLSKTDEHVYQSK